MQPMQWRRGAPTWHGWDVTPAVLPAGPACAAPPRALRLAGSSTLSVCRRGAASTPRSCSNQGAADSGGLKLGAHSVGTARA